MLIFQGVTSFAFCKPVWLDLRIFDADRKSSKNRFFQKRWPSHGDESHGIPTRKKITKKNSKFKVLRWFRCTLIWIISIHFPQILGSWNPKIFLQQIQRKWINHFHLGFPDQALICAGERPYGKPRVFLRPEISKGGTLGGVGWPVMMLIGRFGWKICATARQIVHFPVCRGKTM